MTTLKSSNKDRWPALDGLRAVSIIGVLGFHAGWPGFSGGARGVDLFFVISGFLITWLLVREKDKTGQLSIKKFYWRRFLRIVPAFVVFLVGYWSACMVVFRDLKPLLLSSLLIAATYTTNAARAWFDRTVILDHTWSLSAEEQFYAVWPWLTAALKKQTLLVVTFALVVLAPVYRTLLFFTIGTSGPSHRYVYGPDTRFDTILVGCLLALVINEPRYCQFIRAWARRGLTIPAGIGLLVTSIAVSIQSPFFMNTVGYSLIALSAGILLVAALFQEHLLYGKLLASPPLQWVGRLSYSLYLWHTVALALAGRFAGHLPKGPGIPWTSTSYVTIAFGLASASYYFVEKPFLRLKTRFAVVGVS